MSKFYKNKKNVKTYGEVLPGAGIVAGRPLVSAAVAEFHATRASHVVATAIYSFTSISLCFLFSCLISVSDVFHMFTLMIIVFHNILMRVNISFNVGRTLIPIENNNQIILLTPRFSA